MLMNTTHTNILLSVKELAQLHALIVDVVVYVASILIFVPFVFWSVVFVVFFGHTNMTFNQTVMSHL